MPKAILCPICKNAVLAENPEFPFCSERCRVIDLGKWASGDYKVSTPIMAPEGFEELEREQLKSEMHGEAGGWKN